MFCLHHCRWRSEDSSHQRNLCRCWCLNFMHSTLLHEWLRRKTKSCMKKCGSLRWAFESEISWVSAVPPSCFYLFLLPGPARFERFGMEPSVTVEYPIISYNILSFMSWVLVPEDFLCFQDTAEQMDWSKSLEGLSLTSWGSILAQRTLTWWYRRYRETSDSSGEKLTLWVNPSGIQKIRQTLE